MKKKLLVVAALALLCVFLFAACAGAPGYVMNPPQDSAELVTKLKDDGWETEKMSDSGMTMVTGTKSNVDLDKMDTLNESDKVNAEIVMVMYAGTEAYATIYNSTFEGVFKVLKDSVPKGVSFSYKVKQNGANVSIYMKVSGTVKALNSNEGWDPFGAV